MAHSLRRRFWLEAAFASLTGLAFLATLIKRDWIEAVFGVDPDGHLGWFELVIVVAMLALTMVLGTLARAEWGRATTAFSGRR